MVVEIEQPGVEAAVRQLGIPVKLARTPGEHARLPGPALGEHTEEVLLRGRLLAGAGRRAAGVGRGGRARGRTRGRDVQGLSGCSAPRTP